MHTPTIAFFITPHGYGHATRSAAVMAAIEQRLPNVRFELFTTTPSEIFKDSIQSDFGYHPLVSDIGMVQTSPLAEDADATRCQLDKWLPFHQELVGKAASQIKTLDCALVVSDISPVGIVAAQHAGLPSVLVENFTWDWIYQSYLSKAPGLQTHIDYLNDVFGQADHHIQTIPICRPMPNALHVSPVSRKPRLGRMATRRRLNISDDAKMVLVSMGGVPSTFEFLERLPDKLSLHIVIPGADTAVSPHERVILLPKHSGFFHPDLMEAADVLVGKAGYSTVAEAYHAGIPFGYICRPDFPESAHLERYIRDHLPAKAIDPESYHNGQWIHTLQSLLSASRTPKQTENGADAVAAIIHDKFL